MLDLNFCRMTEFAQPSTVIFEPRLLLSNIIFRGNVLLPLVVLLQFYYCHCYIYFSSPSTATSTSTVLLWLLLLVFLLILLLLLPQYFYCFFNSACTTITYCAFTFLRFHNPYTSTSTPTSTATSLVLLFSS